MKKEGRYNKGWDVRQGKKVLKAQRKKSNLKKEPDIPRINREQTELEDYE